jgi:hypothetical protein
MISMTTKFNLSSIFKTVFFISIISQNNILNIFAIESSKNLNEEALMQSIVKELRKKNTNSRISKFDEEEIFGESNSENIEMSEIVKKVNKDSFKPTFSQGRAEDDSLRNLENSLHNSDNFAKEIEKPKEKKYEIFLKLDNKVHNDYKKNLKTHDFVDYLSAAQELVVEKRFGEALNFFNLASKERKNNKFYFRLITI